MRQLLLFAFLVSGLSMDLWGQEAVKRDVQTGSAQMEKVDLGLPSGLLWGSQNVGAASGILSDPGDVFAWGESTAKTYFEWATYSDTSDSGQTFTKYSNGAKTEITSEDDAACQTLGEGWRVPSAGQWQELIDNCTFDYVVLDDGKYGYKVTGKNGNAIYLPVHESVGDDRYPMMAGFNVYYWTRDLDSQSDAKAQYIRFDVSSGSDISGNTWNDVNVSVLSVERMNPNVIRPVYVGGKLTVSADSIGFGTLKPGSSASKSITVTNTSADIVEYMVSREIGYSLVGNSFHLDGEITGASETYTINPGESATYTFSYTPQYDSNGDEDYAKYSVSVCGSQENHYILLTGKCGDDTPVEYVDKSILIAWQKDGSKVKFNLRDEPKITFMNGSILIEVPSSTFSYEAGTILKMTYELDPDDVEAVAEDQEGAFVQNGESLGFVASDKDLKVRIVATSGIVVREFEVQKGSTASVRLSELVPGVYLINVNDVTYKVNVR